jgi:hypothetical protein
LIDIPIRLVETEKPVDHLGGDVRVMKMIKLGCHLDGDVRVVKLGRKPGRELPNVRLLMQNSKKN